LPRRSSAISRKEIKHIAWLAKVDLTKKEEEFFTKQLNQILNYFRKIDEVDTKGAPPTYHVVELTNVLRPDEVKPSKPSKVIQNVPESKSGYVKAPRII